MFDIESQADNAGRAKGEKKREKTSTSSKENFEQNNNNNNGTKREKKRVSSPTVAEESLLQLLKKAANKGRLNNATKSSLLSRRCSRAVLFLVARGTIKLEQKSLL